VTDNCEHGPIGTGDGDTPTDVTGDPEETDLEGAGDPPPSGFDRWRKDSALGSVGTGIARGLQNVFAPPVDEVVIVAAVPGEPPDAAERVQVILDLDDPTKSVAIVPDPPADPPSD
jgi:hypothetical protein